MEGAIFKAFVELKKLNKTKLATDLGMSKQNLYQLFESKSLQPETIEKIERKFRLKWDKIKQLVNIDVPRGTPKPQEPQSGNSELLDIMRERIKELKEDRERLWRNLETSLTGLTIGQKSILAHVAVILEKDDERDSAGNKRKEQALKDETGKRIVDKIAGVSQMDNSRSG